MYQNFLDNALMAAKSLLGYKLLHVTPDGTTSGIIVETEAYMADDPASHTYRGQTARNKIMFGQPGYAYIYFTYGMHYCFNVVTGSEDHGQGVLIRALEPLEGIDLMKKRRGVEEVRNLTNGPAKLVQAMGITKDDYGEYLFGGGKLRIEPGIKPQQISKSGRIGIRLAVDELYRFYITGSPYVSRP